jgi:hypothetical protein
VAALGLGVDDDGLHVGLTVADVFLERTREVMGLRQIRVRECND